MTNTNRSKSKKVRAANAVAMAPTVTCAGSAPGLEHPAPASDPRRLCHLCAWAYDQAMLTAPSLIWG